VRGRYARSRGNRGYLYMGSRGETYICIYIYLYIYINVYSGMHGQGEIGAVFIRGVGEKTIYMHLYIHIHIYVNINK
jgi:hypothetical protein